MAEKVYLYPVWVRLWHLTNALLCLALILTGISMQYSSPESPLIRFDIAVKIHNIAGIILSASYIFFFIGNLFSGNWRHYIVQLPEFWKRMWKQGRYYAFGFFKKENPPFPIGSKNKFNPLQRLTYTGVMYLFVPVIIVTGWAMMFPDIIVEEWLGMSGFKLTDLLHVIAATIILVFLLIHLYLCTMGKTPGEHFKSMITGYHEHEEKE